MIANQIAAAGAGVALAAGAGTLAYAALSPGSQIFGRTLIAPRAPGELALTFDDGPNGDTTMQLLEILARYEASATFFLIGRFVRQQPGVVRAIRAAGHLVGNHTETHPWLHVCGHERIRRELGDCNRALEDALGEPVRLFRAPHGARRPYVLRCAAELGLTPVQWNIIAGDWLRVAPETLLARIEGGILRNQARGTATNLVLHDGGDTGLGQDREATLAAVDALLGRTKLRCVRVDEWIVP